MRIRGDASRLPRDLAAAKAPVAAASASLGATAGRAFASAMALAGVAGFGGLFLIAGRDAVSFEAIMVDVRANARLLGKDGETAFKKMEKAARKLGATTQFTAVQAAEAMNQLVLGGLKAEQAIGALPSALNLAASAGLGLGEAAKIIVDNMVKYNIATKDTSEIADVLSSAQSRAQITARELADGFKTLGGLAPALGAKFKDVAAILTTMGRSGEEMNQSGTALAMALARISDASGPAAKALDKMGVRIKDFSTAEGGLDIIGLFQAIADGMPTDAIDAGAKAIEIFGIKGKVMLGLLGQLQKGKFLQETRKGFADDIGRAAEVAAAKMDTFRGSLLKFRSALGELFIAGFTPVLKAFEPFLLNIIAATGAIGRLSTAVTKMTQAFFQTPTGKLILDFGKLIALSTALVAALALVKVALFSLVPAMIAAFNTNPIGIIILALAGVAAAIVQIIGEGDTFSEKMQDVFGKKIPAIIDDLAFAFRNFRDLAELALIEVVSSALSLFPRMEVPITAAAVVFIGVWAGVKAFFVAVIKRMIAGLMELKNVAVAVMDGIQAAFASIKAGDFSGAAGAFGAAFIETFAKQENVKFPDALAAASKAFNTAGAEALKSFARSGGLTGALDERRQELLDRIAAREEVASKARVDIVDKAKEKEKKKEGEKEAKKELEKPGFGRTGIAEFGSQIQDAILGNKADQNHDEAQKNLKAADKNNMKKLDDLLREFKAGGGLA